MIALVGVVSGDDPFGYIGAALLALLGAFTLWRSGSVKAWKETAEARAERLEDLDREIASLRTELQMPERIEGIIRLMADTAERQEASATERFERGLSRVDRAFQAHNEAAEARTARLEKALRERMQRDETGND